MRAAVRLSLFAILMIASRSSIAQTSQQLDQLRIEQQRAEAARRAAEEQQRQEEAARRAITDELRKLTPVDISRSAPTQRTEPCLAQAMIRDFPFDPRQTPMADWVAAGEVQQFPWKVQVGRPQLRVDQRYEIVHAATVRVKDLKWSTGAQQELRYVSGISRPDGRWLTPFRAGRQSLTAKPGIGITFADCVFLEPGDYLLWIAIQDTKSSRRNVVKRRISVPEFSPDPMPGLNSRLPAAEYPQVQTGPKAIAISPGEMSLRVANEQPLKLELVPILSPVDQWGGRTDIVRWNNNRILSATSVLSQAKLANGSISARALDLANRTTAFQQQEFDQLDWAKLAGFFTQVAENHTVSVPVLETLKDRSQYFSSWFRERLERQGEPTRVIVLVSGSLLFERGSDLTPIRWEGDCSCRVYHLRFRLNQNDLFDNLEKLIKPLRPKTFNIMTPRDFRKALSEIVKDLEGLNSTAALRQ